MTREGIALNRLESQRSPVDVERVHSLLKTLTSMLDLKHSSAVKEEPQPVSEEVVAAK
jgi:hypothetical protein